MKGPLRRSATHAPVSETNWHHVIDELNKGPPLPAKNTRIQVSLNVETMNCRKYQPQHVNQYSISYLNQWILFLIYTLFPLPLLF